MQQEEDTCMCSASLKTNKSIEMKTKNRRGDKTGGMCVCVTVRRFV